MGLLVVVLVGAFGGAAGGWVPSVGALVGAVGGCFQWVLSVAVAVAVAAVAAVAAVGAVGAVGAVDAMDAVDVGPWVGLPCWSFIP